MNELQQMMEDKMCECEKLNEQKNELKVGLEEHKIRLEEAEKRFVLLIN